MAVKKSGDLPHVLSGNNGLTHASSLNYVLSPQAGVYVRINLQYNLSMKAVAIRRRF